MGGPLQNEHGQMIYFPDEERFPGMPVSGPDRRFMSMIGYLGGKYKICGEKWYGSNPANPARGLPRSILTTILNDADTGAPFAIMSGNQISAMRTGAVPGVIARHLAVSYTHLDVYKRQMYIDWIASRNVRAGFSGT